MCGMRTHGVMRAASAPFGVLHTTHTIYTPLILHTLLYHNTSMRHHEPGTAAQLKQALVDSGHWGPYAENCELAVRSAALVRGCAVCSAETEAFCWCERFAVAGGHARGTLLWVC
jgi:hypothetical protein